MLSEKFWKKYFSVYDILNMVLPYRDLKREVCDELGIKKDDLVLDAGSGTGNFSLYLKNIGGHVISLDNSQSAIKIHHSKDHNAEICFADITQRLPFNVEEFDKIMCVLTLHVINSEKRLSILKEFFRILKPGGMLVLANPYENFNPFRIYTEHIKKDIKKSGLLKVLKEIFILFMPTIKMFYYNIKIEIVSKNQKSNFLKFDEQYMLLKKSGFVNLSDTKATYADSVIINKGYKPI
ncbi:MAG: class I SAM-dependent methyltransferase [Patescibacteria group bacterium]|nr:class I SAM-dependent methyltransferase [Patescibacteria group bacterium]MDD4611216.1 class I SAM-dependent methyltransferase [Patescibacteria group bacterium]